MRFTTPLILLLLAGGLFFWIRSIDEEAPTPGAPRQRLVAEEILARFEEVELVLFSKEVLKIVREPGGRFRMEFGRDRLGNKWLYEDRIDSNMARQVLDALDAAYREELLGEETADDLIRLNLDPPKYQVIVRGGGQEAEIHFGADDPSSGGAIMARDVKTGTIFRVGRQVANVLDFNRDDFRERRVFLQDTRAVDEVSVYFSGSLERGSQEGNPDLVQTLITAKRGTSDRWTVSELGGTPVKADPNKVRGLIQKITSLRIESIKGQDFSNPEIKKVVYDPEDPRGQVELGSGSHTEIFMVGFEMGSEVGGVSERSDPRSNTMTFGVGRDTLVEVLETTVDDLRWRRLAPSFESSLVTVTSTDASGEIRWSVARKNEHVRGPWSIEAPLEGVGVYEGTGEHSWPQVVAELDRLEIEEFVPAEGPFVPEATVRVEWRSGAVARDLELGLRLEGGRVIGHASDRPDERFVLPLKIWEIAHLRIERYRERQILPRFTDIASELTEIEVTNHHGADIGLKKKKAQWEKVRGGDEQPSVSAITAAVTYVCNTNATRIHPDDEAPEDTGLEDPRVSVFLTKADGQILELQVGGSNGGEEVYVSVAPEFAGLVLEVPRGRVKDLLELTPAEAPSAR